MELFEAHFSKLDGNLYFDESTGTYEMFSQKGKALHLNYLTFKELFSQMNGKRDLVILETGMAAHGTNSTYLFDAYIRKYGGSFYSVDTNPELIEKHKGNMCPGTKLFCQDSVEFIKQWTVDHKHTDVVYLDSFDLNFYNHHPSADHGLKEYNAILPTLHKDSLLLIDDTPHDPYWLDTRGTVYEDMKRFYTEHNKMPGKGMYVLDVPKSAETLLHNYQVLYKF
jgi:hypothetical protein